jgi:hypothetical protein
MYTQLRGGGTTDADRPFERYLQSYNEGQATAHRIRLLQDMINLKLSTLDHAFLVLDGYDNLSKGLQVIFDQLFNHFRPSLCVLITRRTPQLIRCLATQCDICYQQGKIGYLSMYWECQKCWEPNENFALCYGCKSRKEKCTECNDDVSFIEPYHHINRKLRVPEEQMLGFVQWSAIEITRRKDTNLELFGRIARQSEGNVTVAKLRLDDLLAKPGSLTGSRDKIADRLPRSLVAFFDAGIKQIMELREEVSKMTLAAIIFVAEAVNNIDIVALSQKLQVAYQNATVSVRASFGCLEDLITAADGYLDMALDTDDCGIWCFHTDFWLYVTENYHQGLFDLRTQLVSQHSSTTPTGIETSDDNSLVESPPAMGHSFDTFGRSMIPDSHHSSHQQDTPFGLGLVEISKWTDSSDRMKMSPPRMDSEQQLPLLNKAAILEAVPQTTRICQFCLAHVFNGETSGSHHTSLKRVAESISEACIVCSSLYHGKSSLAKTNQPIYTWNIQNSGSENLKVTFTRLSSLEKSQAFHMVRGGAGGGIRNFDDVGRSTDPYVSGGYQAQDWLENCDKNHHGCRKASFTDFVPTRLLQLQSDSRDVVKLVTTSKHGIKEPYCTLSHSWGPPTMPFTTTTNDNLQQFQREGIETSDLPKNFRHAIDVARFLKMKYIWIDSLCIIQKDGGEDFKREGDQMHRVYQNSYCNIVAADSADSGGGLFREREVIDIVPATYGGTRIFGHQSWSIIPDDLWDAQLLETRIYSRGWVFQERMLSPRLLHFAKKQIFWDCGTVSACETYPSGLPLVVDQTAATDRHWRGRLQQRSRDKQSLIVGANDDSIETFWQTAVSKYTSCVLTKQMDKTTAIWSIAKTVRDITGEAYACGLWSCRLEEQLAWRISDGGKGSRIAELQWRFPSWSWVSVTGPISAANRIVRERIYSVTDHSGNPIAFPSPVKPAMESSIPELNIEPKYPMPAAIEMSGIVGSGMIRPSGTGSYHLLPQSTRDSLATRRESPFIAFPDEQPDPTVNFDNPCIFVLLAATRYQPESSFALQQLHAEEKRMMYSGVGILLEDPSATTIRYKQEIPRLQREIELITRPNDEWRKTNCLEDIQYTRNLLEQLSHQASECALGKQYYRRTGAIYFEDVSEADWQRLTNGNGLRFWLI